MFSVCIRNPLLIAAAARAPRSEIPEIRVVIESCLIAAPVSEFVEVGWPVSSWLVDVELLIVFRSVSSSVVGSLEDELKIHLNLLKK